MVVDETLMLIEERGCNWIRKDDTKKGILIMTDDYLITFSDNFFDINTNDDIKNILSQSSKLFSELINKLGEISNELMYCVEASKEDGYLHLVITLFVRKLMEQIDAINILFSYGSVTQAELVLRSMLETVISLKFILLKDDTDREETRFRAAAYFMWHHYQEMALADKQAQSGNVMSDEDKQKWNKKKTAINNMIQRNPVFKKVDDERNKLKKPEKSAWYEVAGVHNIREMMTVVGMEEYYEGLYGTLSMETHSLNVAMAMKVKDDGFYPDRIRSPYNGANTFSLTCLFTIIALKVLYKYLGDGDDEKMEFKEFYIRFIAKQESTAKNLSMIAN